LLHDCGQGLRDNGFAAGSSNRAANSVPDAAPHATGHTTGHTTGRTFWSGGSIQLRC